MATQDVLHASRKIGRFVKKILFVTALDLIKCLNQIYQQRLFITCAPTSELPSDKGTMFPPLSQAGGGIKLNMIGPE